VSAQAIDLRALGLDVRRRIIECSKRAHVGHIGSCLSVADILAALYGRILRRDAADPNERDRLILSKGHAALALYAVLHAVGRLDESELDRFCADGSPLGTHPEHAVEGIDFSTGSLGQGLSFGAGAAIAARLQGSSRRSFVVLSDAELNEGSVWEAAAFAGHHRLDKLAAIVDVNGQQAFGYTREVLDPGSLPERWRTVGWQVSEVDGEDPEAIADALASPAAAAAPQVVLAHTVFGSGVPFMESKLEWHYLPMNDAEYEIAQAALESRREA